MGGVLIVLEIRVLPLVVEAYTVLTSLIKQAPG
jgi:hypothetical protein